MNLLSEERHPPFSSLRAEKVIEFCQSKKALFGSQMKIGVNFPKKKKKGPWHGNNLRFNFPYRHVFIPYEMNNVLRQLLGNSDFHPIDCRISNSYETIKEHSEQHHCELN